MATNVKIEIDNIIIKIKTKIVVIDKEEIIMIIDTLEDMIMMKSNYF